MSVHAAYAMFRAYDMFAVYMSIKNNPPNELIKE